MRVNNESCYNIKITIRNTNGMGDLRAITYSTPNCWDL